MTVDVAPSFRVDIGRYRHRDGMVKEAMELQLNAQLQAKLNPIAAERGSTTAALAQEAIERFLQP